MLDKLALTTVVCLCVITLAINYAIAGPFGLFMGTKKSEFNGTLKEIDPYKYITSDVPKKHSAFKSYVLKFGPKCGLCYVKAISNDISTNTYGIEVKNAFDSMEEKLRKVYGENKRLDLLLPGSIWDERRDWMPGLIKGERRLMAQWNKKWGSTLKDDLSSVTLFAGATNRSNGYIVIDYSFVNKEKCDAEIAATENGTL